MPPPPPEPTEAEKERRDRLVERILAGEPVEPADLPRDPPPTPLLVFEDEDGAPWILIPTGTGPLVVRWMPGPPARDAAAGVARGGYVPLDEMTGKGGAGGGGDPIEGLIRSTVAGAVQNAGVSLLASCMEGTGPDLGLDLSAAGLGGMAVDSLVGMGVGAVLDRLFAGVDDEASEGEHLAKAATEQVVGMLQGEVASRVKSAIPGLGGGGGSPARQASEFFSGGGGTVPVGRLGDPLRAKGVVAKGAGTVFVNDLPAARRTDQVASMVKEDAGPLLTGNPTIEVESLDLSGLDHMAIGAQGNVAVISAGSPDVFMGPVGIPVAVPTPDASAPDAASAGAAGSAAGAGAGGGGPSTPDEAAARRREIDERLMEGDLTLEEEDELIRERSELDQRFIDEDDPVREDGEVEPVDWEQAAAEALTDQHAEDAISKLEDLRKARELELRGLEMKREQLAEDILSGKRSPEEVESLWEQYLREERELKKVTIAEQELFDAIEFRRHRTEGIGRAVGTLFVVDDLVQSDRKVKELVKQGRYHEAWRHTLGSGSQAMVDGVMVIVNRIPGVAGVIADVGVSSAAYATGSWVADQTFSTVNEAAHWLAEQPWWPESRKPRLARDAR